MLLLILLVTLSAPLLVWGTRCYIAEGRKCYIAQHPGQPVPALLPWNPPTKNPTTK